MKRFQWNIAMFTALAVFIAIMAPFFSIAQDFDFGDYGNFDPGDFNSFDLGDFNSFDFGDFNSFDFGDFNNFDFGDYDAGTPAFDMPDTGPSAFGPFDDNFQPFDNIPGNPPGPDFIVPDDGDDFPGGCTVNCTPGSTPPPTTPPSTPPKKPESRDTLRIFIHRIALDDPFAQESGNQVPLRITFENVGTKDLDSTKVIVVIPDLAVRDAVGPFDLDRGEKQTTTLLLDLPEDAEPGTYPVRLLIYNEARQRIVHREIDIIDYS